MLKSIRLRNFKLHEDTSIEAAPITVFIGPNNSGKSSIFQALMALKQATSRGDASLCRPLERDSTSHDQPYLFPRGEVVDLGDFRRIVRKGTDELEIELRGDYAHEQPVSSIPPVIVELRVTISQNTLVAHSGMLDTGEAYGLTRWEWVKGMQPQSPQVSMSITGVQVNFSPTDNFRLIGVSGYVPSSPAISPPQALRTASMIGQRLAETVLRLLQSLHPVFPIRGFEEWGYPLPNSRPGSLELISLSDRALALATLHLYDRNLEAELSKTLEDLLGIQIMFQLVEPRKVIIWARASADQKLETLFASEGTGANQLPFILVPTALASPNDTILISEPEAHLHPKAQSKLAALLLTIAKKQNLQFFIETHSEHVLHRLLHAVAKGELARDDLAIYYFPEPKEGKADPQKLKIDEKGGVEGGLPGFFEQSLGELSEYLEALKQPKM